MKKQLVVIGGGTTFGIYEEYISYLKNREVDIDTFKTRKEWKSALNTELGDDFEVLAPQMPNKTNARYGEWKIWFERMVPFLRDEVVLIGHSLGGTFLAKYLAENKLPVKIRATLLVAAPFDNEGRERALTDFVPSSLEGFSSRGGKIILIHSKGDPVVPLEHVGKYKKALPNADVRVFEDRQHFRESFPEIIDLIKGL